MAQAAANDSRTYIYDDSLAYNGVGAAVPEREYDQDEQRRRAVEHERARRRARARAEARTQTKYGISVTAIVGFAVVVALLLAVLVANVSYTEVSDSVVELQQQMEQLDDAEKKLKIQYEEAFDINEIESYAVNTLHMSKPAADQIASSYANSENKAQVIAAEGEGDGVLERFSSFVSSLESYFK